MARTRRSAPSAKRAFLAGGGEMGALMRAFDWTTTPLGPAQDWPQSLKTAVRIMLTSRYAMFVWWGRELVNLYNDAYRPVLGARHPQALGHSAKGIWAEIWDQIGPRADAVLVRGEATFDEALLLIMERYGYPEETYFTFSYSPVPDDQGSIGGVFCACADETERVIGERRLRLLRDLAATAGEARAADDACLAAARCLSANLHDLPFAAIYLVEEDGRQGRLAGAAGIAPGDPACPQSVSLDAAAGQVWPVAAAIDAGKMLVVEDQDDRFANLPTGPWTRPPTRAAIVPIAQHGQARPAGALVVGLNPHRLLDDAFRGFVDLVAGQIGAAIANARAYEAERRRAEALAELDRAKTLFFSNVSHEFRTPLTLMLGPIEEILQRAEPPLADADRELIETVQRNGLRLLKLVNTLLDFSRIEANRFQASYEPTDLPAVTADLAGMFRSAIEGAGMRLIIECPPLNHPVHVDREMWEKIVLNLVSNAFKFTLEGAIEVRLRAVDSEAVLTVRDTGIGIPEAEIPRVFERFHRIEDSRGRTHEGTGIGLALVQELVELHGGAIELESAPGAGSTFRVRIPFGTGHLAADRIGGERTQASTGIAAKAYVEEALRWLPDDARPGPTASSGRSPLPEDLAAGERPCVLVADDNADMRDYVRRLLVERFEVAAVADGRAALEAALADPPDLILADVMMPQLDGFGLLRELRSRPETSLVPVIMLSARAGEEARVEGLEAGADDYLIKPFSARELVARVQASLALAQLRREAAERERSLRAEVEGERDRLRVEIEERKRAQEHRDLVIAELDHRVKNTLATIQAMVGRTALGQHGKEDFVAALQGRITAMARAHSLLTRERWQGAGLRQVMIEELLPYGADTGRVAIGDEDLLLGAKAAMAIGMVVHELTTNSAKYGALSAPGGRVEIAWHTENGAGGGRLRIAWIERGGPPVATPQGRGFGSMLIEQVVAYELDGEARLDFDPAGLRCHMDVPLDPVVLRPARSAMASASMAPAPAAVDGNLAGARVLVVEDSMLVAFGIAADLADAGAEVVGPVASLEQALQQAQQELLDAAVLDVNLSGQTVDPVADALLARGVPFVFCTGYDSELMLPGKYRGARALQKPFSNDTLVQALLEVLERRATD